MAGIAIAAIQGTFLLLWAGMHGRRFVGILLFLNSFWYAKSKQRKKQAKKHKRAAEWAEGDILVEGDDYERIPPSQWTVPNVASWATHTIRLDREDVNMLVSQKISGGQSYVFANDGQVMCC